MRKKQLNKQTMKSDYYATSKVMYKLFRNEKLNVHDKINLKTLYNDPSYGNKSVQWFAKERLK